MREIEFRALFERISDKKSVWQYIKLEDFLRNLKTDVSDAEYNQITPWLQYTGLKDKNGKMIFEGDICLFPSGRKKEIIFRNGAFGYETNDEHIHLWFDGVEIIGNIHENPELLEE